MSNLTASTSAIRSLGDASHARRIAVGVKASTTLYEGTIGGVNASGYAVAGASAVRVLGRVERTVDNSAGANGDLDVVFRKGPMTGLSNSGTDPVTVADIGNDVFLEDDHTIARKSGGTLPRAGKFLGFDEDSKPIVEIGSAPGLKLQTGSATLVAGTVTVEGVKLTSDSVIIFSRKTSGGTAGHLSAPGASRNTTDGSFVISSSSNTETSTVDYVIVG